MGAITTGSIRPRVLMADDYKDLLGAFERLLAPTCDVVGCVSDGDALFEAMASLKPDVIVLDVFMPPTNGFEICREIKRLTPSTVVIIVSAAPDRDVREQALQAGASAFVAKGAAIDDLVPAITRGMARTR
jgi:two-component system, NarL family, invasion response regulator UvrY